MEKYDLGPNGGLIFCMETLQENVQWLIEQISNLKCNYFIFDCPGQVCYHINSLYCLLVYCMCECRLNCSAIMTVFGNYLIH